MANTEDEDLFQILLATDCHLGYQESDAIRGSDAIVTFEEILKIAVEKEVDFILLGGDLFHENKPSRKILHDCISLLRKYCMGDRPIQFEFLSDQSENFKHCAYPLVNFEDPNINISMPVFSIHGNHDDPAGAGCYCTLDMLSATGLVNYFGKCMDLENISISPLMLQKGKTKLCLYGLGSIRDERLHRMFVNGKVTMLRPREKCDEWFNLMVLHQNRAKHGAKNYIPEQFLDNFLDLVVWGHEHECRIDREWNERQNFYVTQPGSSIATSLCHGESVPKHVGILQIKRREFQITKVPLQTVRQFYIRDLNLEETSLSLNDPDSTEKVMDYCKELVDQFLEKSEGEYSGHPKQPKQPLVRLRIIYPPNFEPFSVHRFGHSYVSKVANSKDIILFIRKKRETVTPIGIDNEVMKEICKEEGFDKSRVEDLVKKYFEQTDEDKRLLVLSEIGVSSAVQEYVDKEVKEAIITLVEHQVKKTQNHLKESVTDSSVIDDALVKFREHRKRNSENESSEFRVIMQSTMQTKMSDDDSFDESTVEVPAPKTRGRGRGRGSRGARGASSARNESTTSISSRRNTSRSNVSSTSTVQNSPKRRRAASRNSSTRNSSRQTDLSSYFQNGSSTVNDCINISDDDDDYVPNKRRKTATQTSGKRGVVFSDSD